MACHRCEADPQPSNFGSPRRCAFNADGTFTPENWNCATIDALLIGGALERYGSGEHGGDDETMQVVYSGGGYGSGWIVLTRYKRRGCTSSAVHVGDFWPAKPLTLAITEAFIAGTYDGGDED
jgi:hypothetical protein